MNRFPRITRDPAVMNGKPCIRGTQITVGLVLGMLGAGHSPGDLLRMHLELEADDIKEALGYAALLVSEQES